MPEAVAAVRHLLEVVEVDVEVEVAEVVEPVKQDLEGLILSKVRL